MTCFMSWDLTCPLDSASDIGFDNVILGSRFLGLKMPVKTWNQNNLGKVETAYNKCG